MTVVRGAGRERRAIVEHIWWIGLGKFNLPVERIYFVPMLEHALFFRGKVDGTQDGQ